MIYNVVTLTIADVSLISTNAKRRTISNKTIYLDINVRCCPAESGPVCF